jgi:hypothetical protein
MASCIGVCKSLARVRCKVKKLSKTVKYRLWYKLKIATRYESFAKLIIKTGLLRVILYYMNLLTPPKNT